MPIALSPCHYPYNQGIPNDDTVIHLFTTSLFCYAHYCQSPDYLLCVSKILSSSCSFCIFCPADNPNSFQLSSWLNTKWCLQFLLFSRLVKFVFSRLSLKISHSTCSAVLDQGHHPPGQIPTAFNFQINFMTIPLLLLWVCSYHHSCVGYANTSHLAT